MLVQIALSTLQQAIETQLLSIICHVLARSNPYSKTIKVCFEQLPQWPREKMRTHGKIISYGVLDFGPTIHVRKQSDHVAETMVTS